ncbi:MAG TPA: IS110 family transposase [Streptosporangiaceae bacterium]|jgi:transposase|nr:IS110 family transposase [Streptosporangiaceae bacterium]
MEISPSPAATATDPQPATLFVALELSKAKWLVGLHSPMADKVSRHTIAGGDAPALLTLIGAARRRAEAGLGGTVRVVTCYEAGYDGFWLHRLLVAHGIANQVIDPASLLVNRRARRRKTDRIDLAGLLRTLMAWHRGEPQVCSMVRVPSPEEEDRRRRGRERERLVKERVQHLGRVKGLLMTQGVRDFQPARRGWRDRLEALRTGDGRPLPDCLKAEIARECRRLALVDEMLDELERERDAASDGKAPQQAALLTKLRGIGPTSAHLLAGEVFHRDFANRRQVAAYLGLEPSPWQSGQVDQDQGISKAGNRRARRVAIELAWLWLQHQPDSGLSRWFKDRVGAARGRVRRIMLVALARKLIVALWRYLASGVVPEGASMRA